jgi:predicted small secreted protein
MSIHAILKTGLAAALAATTLTSCNTVAGMGRDLSAIGDAIAGTADQAKPSNQARSDRLRREDDGKLLGGPPKQPPRSGSGRPAY